MRLIKIFALMLFFVSCAWADGKPLANLNSKDLKLRLSNLSPESASLTLSRSNLAKLEIFKIADPARLVIDLAKFDLQIPRPITPNQNNFVTKIRLGSHSDKIRIVLDLVEPTELRFKIQETPNQILIILSTAVINDQLGTATPSPTVVESSTPVVSPAAPIQISVDLLAVTRAPSPSVSPSSTPLPETSASPSPSASTSPEASPSRAPPSPSTSPVPSPSPSPGPSSTPSSTPSISPSPDPSSAPKSELVIEKLAFDTLSSGLNVIRLSLSKKTAYSLSQINDSKYKLSVARAIALSQALLPQFPPYDFFGIDYVSPSQNTNGYDLEIGVASGTKLTTYARGDDILIKAAPP